MKIEVTNVEPVDFQDLAIFDLFTLPELPGALYLKIVNGPYKTAVRMLHNEHNSGTCYKFDPGVKCVRRSGTLTLG